MKSWLRFWFQPHSPELLGLCRMVLFGALFLFYLRADYSAWGDVSRVFWMPMSYFKVLHLAPLTVAQLTVLQIIWKVSLLTAAIGIATRLSTGVAFLLGAYLLGLPQCFGKIGHADASLVLILAIMALSRCGAAWSLDAFFRRNASDPTAVSGEYTWPIRAVQLTLAMVFLSAGISKLRESGLEWIFSDNLAGWLALINKPDGGLGSQLALEIARHGWLGQMFAAIAVVTEIGYCSALFSRVCRWIFVPAAILMLIGFRVLLGPVFIELIILQLFWVRWDVAWSGLSARWRSA